MSEKHHWRDPKKLKKYQQEYYQRQKQIAKEEERQHCYDPHPEGERRESVSVRLATNDSGGNRRNRQEQLNDYWRDQRAEIRRARVRSELRLVGAKVFLSNPQLLRQVKNWIDIAGVDYARKSLAETGVASPSIDKILEAALGRS